MFVRFVLLVSLFAVELLAISIRLDGASVPHHGLAGVLAAWGSPVLRTIVASAAVFLLFACLHSRTRSEAILMTAPTGAINWILLGAHFAAMAAFGGLSARMFSRALAASDVVAAGWLAAGFAGIGFGACALVPLRNWVQLFQATGNLCWYSIATGFAASALGRLVDALWKPVTAATFTVTTAILKPFLTGLLYDPATYTIGTNAFRVVIAPSCSGLEGAGLMLAFGVAWIWYFRDEFRFPRILLLIPCGIVILWLVNAIRIALLIVIGNAGAPSVALGGFHSQAGWIGFILVALGLSTATRSMPWLTVPSATAGHKNETAPNPTAACLVPFLAILAAGMVSGAASGGFEWLYGLRVAGALAALWYYRHSYRKLAPWHAGWLSLATGVIVFAVWLAIDRLYGSPVRTGMPAALAATPWRTVWIAIRIFGAVVTVPIAEELAFRAFLMRRLISARFECVRLQQFSLFAFAVSSFAFGLMHGQRWIAGTLAGALYAMVMLRRGRVGDAILAHATTNLLLALWVLTRGEWQLW